MFAALYLPDFELQAAATEDAIILSLGPTTNETASVLKGAAPNEVVALGPFERLSNGQRVR